MFLDDLPLSGVLEWELTQGTVLQVKLIVGPDGIPPPDDEDEYDMVLMPVWVPVPT